MRSGITRRWLRGSLLITVLLVLLVEVMFLYSATRSYYNGVQQTMYRRFSSITGQLKMYTGETSQKTAASRSVALRRMVEQFSDKDKYEFMLLDSYGGVIASSSGTDAEGIVTHTDFEQAQDAVDGQGIAIYHTQSGEMVMAACCLVPYAAEDVAAMRLVTSLTLVDHHAGKRRRHPGEDSPGPQDRTGGYPGRRRDPPLRRSSGLRKERYPGR